MAAEISFRLENTQASPVIEPVVSAIVDGIASVTEKVVDAGSKALRLIFGGDRRNGILVKEDGLLSGFYSLMNYKAFTIEVDGTQKKIWVDIDCLSQRTGRSSAEIKAARNLTNLLRDRPRLKSMIEKVADVAKQRRAGFQVRKGFFDRTVVFRPDGSYFANKQNSHFADGTFKKAKDAQSPDGKAVARLVSKESLQEEFETMQRFSGPGVAECLPCHRYISKKGQMQSAMFMPKYPYDLSQKFTHLTAEEKRKVIHQLLQAVVRINQQGIHRDLKLENVLLDDEMNAHITDFGLYQDYADRFAPSSASPQWAAPEVWQGGDPENCDVWSLGLLCGFLCIDNFAQRCPWFRERDPEAIGKMIGGLQQELWHEALSFGTHDEQMIGLIKQMLAVDPAQRISAEKALQEFDRIYSEQAGE